MPNSVINQDLARWSGRKWFWTVAFVAALQFAAIFYLPRPIPQRAVYPLEPAIQLPARSSAPADDGWLEVQDPMLFAAPNWKSVSALAWMRKPRQELSPPQEFPRLQFLSYHDARSLAGRPALPALAAASAPRRAPSEITLPVVPPPAPERRSTLAHDGFDGRAPVALPDLPPQYHNDYVSRTIVQAAIGPAGEVLSARVVASSGSKPADADAMAIARQLRFEAIPPSRSDPAEISWGKLIFAWHALNLSPTNTVKR